MSTLELPGITVPQPAKLMAISLWQPWATFIALGVKTIETRHWPTPYRGRLVVHAAKRRGGFLSGRYGPWAYDGLTNTLWREEPDGSAAPGTYQTVPLGAYIAVTEVVACVPTNDIYFVPDEALEGDAGWSIVADGHSTDHLVRENERPYGDYSADRYGWFLANSRPLVAPIAAPGHQGFWKPDEVDEILAQAA